MQYAISKPSIVGNNNPVAIIPNSCKFDEGEGETTVRNQSTGGGGNEVVVSDNAEEKVGKLMFDLMNTIGNIELVRGWKKNPGQNYFEVTGSALGQTFARVFTDASVVNNYEVELSTDGKISVEVIGAPPV